ncbi:MAG TPA: VWA domain-containing protein [Longimicrobiales bacterium]
MSFARPDLLWLAVVLPVLVAAGVLGYARRRRRVAARLGAPELVRRLGAGELQRPIAGGLVLVVLAAAALGFAAAGPRWGWRAVEHHGRARSIVLALDVSKSMFARDLTPSRLERERLLARRLLRELGGDRIGLVAFAGRAYILAPLTLDHSALELYVDALDPDIVSYGGSSLAAALRQATDLALGQESAGRDRAIVLATDGEAHEPEAAVLAEAKRAADAGIVVHTVGIGGTRGEPIPERDPRTGQLSGYKRDANGEVVMSRLNEALLSRIAEMTGGRYVRLDEAGATDRLLGALRAVEQTHVQGERSLEPRPRHAWFVALALVLLAAEAIVSRTGALRAAPVQGQARRGA